MQRMVAIAISIAAIFSFGCQSPEQEVVDLYLDASQKDDKATIGGLSEVSFPEEVKSWKILEVGDARSESYAVPGFLSEVKAVEEERDAKFKIYNQFRVDNYQALQEIAASLGEDPDHRFRGNKKDLLDRWNEFREERKEVMAKLYEVEIQLEEETRLVNKSLQRESTPEFLVGNTLRKDVRVQVVTQSGENVFLISLAIYELKNQFDDALPARWFITRVEKTS